MTSRFLSPLGVRLTAAFVTVAVAAVIVFAALSLATSRTEVSRLVDDIHRDDARAAAAEAGRAHEAAGGWRGADLTAVAAVAARGQATVVVSDERGQVIAAPIDEAAEMMARMHGVELLDTPRGAPVEAPVVVDGDVIGSVALRFPSTHLPSPQRHVRDALARSVAAGTVLATVVAVAVAVLVASRVSRPIAALTDAAARLEAGERDVRVEQAGAPGELGTLAAAFDRMAAAVQREDELRRRLVQDVAHEVRTPLTILQATTEGLVDGALTADPATLESLHDEVLRLGRLVADLETLAAADAAGLELHLDRVDLAEVAGSVVESVRAAAADAGLSVAADLHAAPCHGDDRRLHQVVTNLVANALHYTPAGGAVTVRTGVDGGSSFVDVVDSGPGIDDDELDRVFDRFYRGRAAQGTSGSGIGLAVASELAAAHRGSVRAGNTDGGGASFRLALPAAAR